MDIFEKKNIDPMLIAENRPAFDSPEYIYELKFDGIRTIVYLDNDYTAIRNKRQKVLDHIFPELAQIHRQVKKRCILDGEIVVFKGGKPSFAEVQARSLMSNQFKIELATKKLPASFVAFDILYLKDKQITDMELTERKSNLEKIVTNGERMMVSPIFNITGTSFFSSVKEQGLEGIVAKRKESKYYFGKRTKDWIKCKALLDEDFIVCGYYFKAENFLSVVLGSYQDKAIRYRGHVVMGVSRQDFKEMQSGERTIKERYYASFPEFEGAVWLSPALVCVVEFMEYTRNDGLRQPIYRGLRNDKSPDECVLPSESW